MARIEVKAIGGPPPDWLKPDLEIRIVKSPDHDELAKSPNARRLCLLFAEHLALQPNEYFQLQPDFVIEARADVLDVVAEAVYALALPEPLWIGASWADFLEGATREETKNACAKAYVFRGAFNCHVAEAVPVILKGAERQGFTGRISLVYLGAEDFELRPFDALLTRAFGPSRQRIVVATATAAKTAICTVIFVMKEIDDGGRRPLAKRDQRQDSTLL